jgi:hypothetical protein
MTILPIVYYVFKTWYHSLRKEHKLQMFKNSMPRKIFASRMISGRLWYSFIRNFVVYTGVRSSVVGWGTTLQAGRSQDQIPDEVDFFNLPNSSSCTIALWSTQPLKETSTRNISGGEGWLARKADNLTAIYEPIVYKNVGASTSHNPMGLHSPLQGYLYLTFTLWFIQVAQYF